MAGELTKNIYQRSSTGFTEWTGHEGGTGLGLAIVKHIVQYHRGNIDVQSKKNIGTSFKISISA
ncbi:MAG: ATP-binding protein [Desulfobacula sp.]|nr:ATP-binding protein [Desulfobacula sp.]